MIQTKDTTITDELAACPFCGGEAEYLMAYGVQCKGCGAKVPATFEERFDAWNTRPKETPTERGEVARRFHVEGQTSQFGPRWQIWDNERHYARFRCIASMEDADNICDELNYLASLSHPVSTNMQVAEAVKEAAAKVAENFPTPADDQATALRLERAKQRIAAAIRAFDLSTITASSTTEGGGE